MCGSLQGFSLLFYRYSLSATLLSLILGLHSGGMFWLFGTILWYCGIIVSSEPAHFAIMSVCLEI